MSAAPRAGRGWLAALLAVFAALAGTYSLATPVFEGPDEIWHFAFASHLAEGGALPVLSAQKPNLLLRNAAHPPLYYLPVAGVIAPIDRQDFPSQFRFNLGSPHITPGSVSDRPNLMLHTRHEDWPYRQSVLAVRLGRLVSVALGALTVAGVYAAAGRLIPASPRLAFLAAITAAFVPQFVYGSAVINNDALAAAAGAWLLWALLALMETPSPRRAVAAGLVLAVGLLSKIGMVAMLPLPAAALALAVIGASLDWPRRADRSAPAGGVTRHAALVAGLITYGVAAVAAGWWYVRNWWLYGDPLAWREWQALAGVGRSGLTLAQFAADMAGLFGTFWADFGMRADRAWGWAFALVALAAGAGLLLRWRRRYWPPLNLPGLLLAALWLALLLGSAVRYALDITDIHGRLLYPALTPVAVALVLGLSGWGPGRAAALGLAPLAAGGLFMLSAAAPFALILPAFARPTAATVPPGAVTAEAIFGDTVGLHAFALAAEPREPGQPVATTTYWRLAPGAEPGPDARAVLALVRPDGTVVGRQEALLGSSVYPSSVWVPGDLIRLDAAVLVDPGAEAPVVAEVWLGVRAGDDTLLPGPQGDTVILGRVAVVNGLPCSVPARGGQVFGGQIRLAGWKVGQAGVTLCWEPLQPLDQDYTVFVHVVEAAGSLLATGDSQPRSGQYPTTAWLAGQMVEDHHAVVIPPDARIQVGFYLLADGSRLPVDGTDQTFVELTP